MSADLSSSADRDIPAELSDAEYNRRRWAPRPGDGFYLHLSDLRLALEQVKNAEPIRILDYGCGGSPYRELFPNADYQRADLAGTRRTDYEVRPDGSVTAPASHFDLVLSTQVLEHCAHPEVYLRECARVLRSDGQLVLTTHGLYEDHGCPFDFHRWTGDGLKCALEQEGFQGVTVRKLTSNARALLHFMFHYCGVFHDTPRPTVRFCASVAFKLLHKCRPTLESLADQAFMGCRVVDAADRSHGIYVALFALARRA